MNKQTILQNLIPNGWETLEFQFFRQGVDIFWISKNSPQIALLKYQAGASVPRHKHIGLETILVLEGDQVDDNGTALTGDFVVNPAGTEHAVRSETGCIVLIQWEKPVEFV